ncbi:hypothetical protein [Vagococcus silagei]|uniref:Niacin transporter NiaX n=1 Tax=Vagococcus silagei TaxID=2508885 RepID=A0A4S3B7C3_9ENTE|nr:hypothetical protein [Vagococcus silagei]THB60605.1 hypothetical protein ESZ54_09320 [Vagococcus silagei]
MKKSSTQSLTYSAILIALGILIPMIMPVRIILGPATYTLASHVPIFLAMFISPGVAALVALGTAFGFFLTSTFVVALRALSHIVFAVLGAWYLSRHPEIVSHPRRFMKFNIAIGVIHATCETLVVTIVMFTGQIEPMGIWAMILLLGVGGFVHSLVDGTIAYTVSQQIGVRFKFPVYLKAQRKDLKS